MSKFKEIVEWRTVSGEGVTAGDATLTPQSQALIFRWPNGGLVWNRPVAVVVERDGQSERVPIVDVTRLAQVGLLGLALFFVLAAFFGSSKRRRD